MKKLTVVALVLSLGAASLFCEYAEAKEVPVKQIVKSNVVLSKKYITNGSSGVIASYDLKLNKSYVITVLTCYAPINATQSIVEAYNSVLQGAVFVRYDGYKATIIANGSITLSLAATQNIIASSSAGAAATAMTKIYIHEASVGLFTLTETNANARPGLAIIVVIEEY